MTGPVQDWDKRPHAILDSCKLVLVEDLRSLEEYTFAPIYRRHFYIGDDAPPSVMGSIWFQEVCGYCMKRCRPGTGGVTRIIPRSWGGAIGLWNNVNACEECVRWKRTKTGWSTFDGREGVYWNGSLWSGEKMPRPKFARDVWPPELSYFSRKQVEMILPHRAGGLAS